jgi:hypothetical protein
MNAFLLPLVAAFAVQGGEVSDKGISTWFAPSTVKVMRDAKPDGAAATWNLAAARNELESCQLVLVSERPIRGVTVTASPAERVGGKGSLQPALFKVEYVPVLKERVPHPDPLPPLAGPLSLQPKQAQPVWISVRVPKDAAPGMYHGKIRVATGGCTKELPLDIKVWDFELPATPSCTTAFGLGYGHIAERHEVKPGSPEANALNKKYYEFVLDHRISPTDIPVDLMSKEAAAFLDDPRMTCYRISYLAGDDQLKALVNRLIAGGWFAKGFFYEVDEPSSKAAYDAFATVNERLRKIEPRYRIVTPFWSNPDFDNRLRSRDLMLGKVNIWCPHLDYVASEPNFRQFLKGRMNAGETIWWYVCNNPRKPYNNLHIDMSAMAHRTLLWQQKREGLQGLLYWSVNYWAKQFVADPWQDMDTIGTGYYGDGSLLYPGKKVGIDGPVGSIRLELVRDGLEDYEYLQLYEKLFGREKTEAIIGKLVKSRTEYSEDASALESVRRELGTAIEKGTRGHPARMRD